MKFIYSLFVHTYTFGIRVSSLFLPKAQKWVNGRRDVFEKLNDFVQSHPGPRIWMHCASLGEFEQGRPVIESLRKKYPKHQLVLSFFSPSGYEIRKDYPLADLIIYLPSDTPSNSKSFIRILAPEAVFFVKYEFWFNYLHQLKKNKVPTFLISGIFRKDQLFFRSYGKWFARQLEVFTCFFVQNQESAILLASIGFTNIMISGDTRFDRVASIAASARTIREVEEFREDSRLLVAGSTWPKDEELLAASSVLRQNYKLILAPHELSDAHLNEIEQRFSGWRTVRFSAWKKGMSAELLIIDNIGILSSLYRYGRLAYVGGGFGKGIHNVLEAATYGIPVLFGPNHQKFLEASDLLLCGGAKEISGATELDHQLSSFSNEEEWDRSAKAAGNYVSSKTGATELIIRDTTPYFSES